VQMQTQKARRFAGVQKYKYWQKARP
jgi:hypothetical protein